MLLYLSQAFIITCVVGFGIAQGLFYLWVLYWFHFYWFLLIHSIMGHCASSVVATHGVGGTSL